MHQHDVSCRKVSWGDTHRDVGCTPVSHHLKQGQGWNLYCITFAYNVCHKSDIVSMEGWALEHISSDVPSSLNMIVWHVEFAILQWQTNAVLILQYLG